MLSSDQPSRIPLPFANSGTKNTIPVASQIGITPGAASLTDGFPPLTFTPLEAGGVPPFGADFNGILNMATAILRWQSAGGVFAYDASFASMVGGYPKGAVLRMEDNSGLWLNQTDGNATDPDAGGAGWVEYVSSQFIGSNHSLLVNGYQRIPGGLIIQKGLVTAGSGTTFATVTFPITFPNACQCVFLCDNGNQGWAWGSNSIGLSGFVANKPPFFGGSTSTNTSSTSSTGNAFFLAIGY